MMLPTLAHTAFEPANAAPSQGHYLTPIAKLFIGATRRLLTQFAREIYSTCLVKGPVMKVVAHIGHHKTGTTTLQAFLSQNSHRLLQNGILYPWTESEGAAHAVAKAMGVGDRQEVLPFNIREAHNALAFRILSDALPGWKVPPYHKHLPHSRQMMFMLSNQIAALNPKAIVLCSEVMSHFGKIAPDQIGRMRTQAFGEAEEFVLWCTLRRPDEQLVSWHGQQLRFGQSPAPLSNPEHGMNLDWLHVDYRGVIEPWLTQIPEAKPALRPYREVIAAGGSVEDFVKGTELPWPSDMLPAGTMNVSFKPAIISLLRLSNKDLPPEDANKLMGFAGILTKGMKLPASSEVEFLGAAQRARLAAHFAPIHDWLSQTSGRAAFFTDIAEMEQCRPISERESLQALLDQITPFHLAAIPTSRGREFVSGLKKQGAVI